MAIDPAILFWCHCEPAICVDHIDLLRRHNPGTPIFLLFGGDPEEEDLFRSRLGPLVDDFHVFDDTLFRKIKGPDYEFGNRGYWKWRYCDLILDEWHRSRGVDLEWDMLAIVQWDTLVYGNLAKILRGMQPGEILLPGMRRLADIEDRWEFTTSQNPPEREQYLEFIDHVAESYDYRGDPHAFLSMFMVMPRKFFDRFAEIERPDLGFIEYRIPVYAEIFGTPLCTDHPLRPWWNLDEPDGWSTLRTNRWPISPLTILTNLARPRGARIFHPYYRPAPKRARGWFEAIKTELVDDRPPVLDS